MSYQAQINKYKFIIDPTNRFAKADVELLCDLLGVIPQWLSQSQDLPAREVIDKNYQHGGGWNSFHGFKMGSDGELIYPGDPTLYPIAVYIRSMLNEVVYQYEYGWVAIVSKNNIDVARID